MSCCSSAGCTEFFTDRVARRDAARFRRRGLDGHARDVVEAVMRRGVAGRRVLEVGGGVGTIQIELLRAGAGASEIVDISPAYDREAERLLDDAGLRGRVARRHLDFAAEPDCVDPADIVVMNRVLCCYPDYAALTRAAADHANAMLVVTYPRDAWWTRAGIHVLNMIERGSDGGPSGSICMRLTRSHTSRRVGASPRRRWCADRCGSCASSSDSPDPLRSEGERDRDRVVAHVHRHVLGVP